jgi:hypothetical protein
MGWGQVPGAFTSPSLKLFEETVSLAFYYGTPR